MLSLNALSIANQIMDEPPAHLPPVESTTTPDEADREGTSGKGGKSSKEGKGAADDAKEGKSAKAKKGDRTRRGHLLQPAFQSDNQTASQQGSDSTAEQTAGVVGAGDRDVLVMRVNYQSSTPSFCNEACVISNMWTGSPSVDSM